jgi:hypothetical protein
MLLFKKLLFKNSLILLLLFISSKSVSQPDLIAAKTTVPITIDGIANEAIWANTPSYPIDQAWLFSLPLPSDFTGSYKLAWDQDYLYLMAEITDDMLSDDQPDPLRGWWDDDCVEIFIDENRSKGEHEYNYNAFAYHVSIYGQVVDWTSLYVGSLFNDHITSRIQTVGTKTIWECRIKIYADTFVYRGLNTPVTLTAGKIMGFSVAYCDNDAGTTREGFIGSGAVPGTNKNVGYLTADYFQQLTLVENTLSTPTIDDTISTINIFPNPANISAPIYLKMNNNSGENALITICDLSGKLVYKMNSKDKKMVTIQLDSNIVKNGVYVLSVANKKQIVTKKLIIVDK